MRVVLPRLPYLLLPVALFLALFHPAILDIGNVGWLIRGSDGGENALGLHAWLHDGGAGLRPHTRLLGAPEGVSLLFTDSNPLVALLVAPFAAWLPADAQFVGPWLLLCLALHVGFAHKLLERYAPGPLALWAGVALLSALPTLFNRYVHANLFAHWLILAALWLFVAEERSRRWLEWALLIAVTALVHSYLLVMVGAIWASAVLRALIVDGERGRVLTVGVATLVMVAAIAWWLGVVGGGYAATGTYGAFAMPLDALWNPTSPSYSAFLPATAQREGRGYEGFQYLGAGLLLLVLVAAALVVSTRATVEQRRAFARLAWLLPALIVLTLVAISNFPDFAGERLPRFALPAVLAPVLDVVRASGRLFWPAAYTLVFAAILMLYRLSASRAGLLLAGLLALQMIDLVGLFAAVRQTSAEAVNRQRYVRTVDPRWQQAIGRARDIAFVPGDVTKDLALFQEVAWRATTLGRPVRAVYAARESIVTKRRLADETSAFVAGERVPGRLYVLLPGAPRAKDAAVIDGVAVVLP